MGLEATRVSVRIVFGVIFEFLHGRGLSYVPGKGAEAKDKEKTRAVAAGPANKAMRPLSLRLAHC